jgi:glycosyltransferase involved in cell wall biosynthesis
MKVWVITVGEPLPKYSPADRTWRSGYLAGLLARRGHDVTWWVSSFDHFRKVQLEPDSRRVPLEENLALQFLRGRDYPRNISFARLANHREIGQEFRRLAREYPLPDVVLCSFPTIELSREATAFGREKRVPVVLDIRDLWPDEMLERLPRFARGLGKLLLAPLYAGTRRAMRDATALVAISNSFLDWGLGHARRARGRHDRVFPMGYTGALDQVAVDDAVRAALAAKGVDARKRIFWFSGTFVSNIDLGTVIEAARRLRDEADVQFVLCGAGERDAEWRGQAHGLANVVFTGWAGARELACMASLAWAGLGAYEPHARMSFPNKVFEYMSAGQPVLLSLGGETRELVEQNSVGLGYTAGDPASLAAAVRRLASDPALRATQSANARRLFRERFAPEVVYGEYADYLVSLARQGRGGSDDNQAVDAAAAG